MDDETTSPWTTGCDPESNARSGMGETPSGCDLDGDAGSGIDDPWDIPDPPPVTAGEVIRQAREACGMSQLALAERAGTSQAAIARWEGNRIAASFKQVERLARLCGFAMAIELLPTQAGSAPLPDHLLRGPLADGWW